MGIHELVKAGAPGISETPISGTDAIAVVNGWGPVKIRYCGKHVLFGEMLANAVIEALTNSLHKSEDFD